MYGRSSNPGRQGFLPGTAAQVRSLPSDGPFRIEGHPFGFIANNTMHMGGAIEAEGADKAARLMQLCNAHGVPSCLSVTHTGIHGGARYRGPGPGSPRLPHVRQRRPCDGALFHHHPAAGLWAGRHGHGQGGFHESIFTAAWPTAEFGGMGLEGAVKAGFKKELAAIENPEERGGPLQPVGCPTV